MCEYGYKISDNTKIENSLTLKDSFLNYDEPTNGRDDTRPSTDDTEGHYNLKFINAKNDYEAMAIVRDNYDIPLGWIKSSTLAKSGGK